MHRFAGFSLVCLLVTQTLAAAAGPFPDKNLEAAVRATLQNPKGDLTDELLRNVSVLEANGKSIKDLTGLEKCKNLLGLTLASNQIADLSPLKDLTQLQTLDLSKNQVADL